MRERERVRVIGAENPNFRERDRKVARAVKIEMQRETETKREKGQATKIAADQCVLLMDKRGKSTKCGTPEFSQKQFILFLFIVDLYMCMYVYLCYACMVDIHKN